MRRYHFNRSYTRIFAEPLYALGFAPIGRSKSLRVLQGNIELRLIVPGGKLAQPGLMRTTICIRHMFLRTHNSNSPALEIRDFPRRLTFDDFSLAYEVAPKYRPEFHQLWKYHTLDYKTANAQAIEAKLTSLKDLMVLRIMPWLATLTPESELAQIRQSGGCSWIERRWIADYENFIAGPG